MMEIGDVKIASKGSSLLEASKSFFNLPGVSTSNLCLGSVFVSLYEHNHLSTFCMNIKIRLLEVKSIIKSKCC